MAKPPPLTAHIPTSDEIPSHLVEKVNADGTLVVRDKGSGALTVCRVGVLLVNGQLTLIAIGPAAAEGASANAGRSGA